MIVFNTTYLVAKGVETAFLQWMKSEYAPLITQTGLLTNGRLFKVLVSEEEGITYSLQFDAEGVSEMADFKKRCWPDLEKRVSARFGEAVLQFSTYLKSCDL
ncbi:MAG: DUF4286 family protein [Paludibacteraceae bacterium]|nr:DUF4286 family protein [Paludibacteraceae bacterium]